MHGWPALGAPHLGTKILPFAKNLHGTLELVEAVGLACPGVCVSPAASSALSSWLSEVPWVKRQLAPYLQDPCTTNALHTFYERRRANEGVAHGQACNVRTKGSNILPTMIPYVHGKQDAKYSTLNRATWFLSFSS